MGRSGGALGPGPASHSRPRSLGAKAHRGRCQHLRDGTMAGYTPAALMPSLIDTRTITCPHCWEGIQVVIDASEPTQSYIEDCSVCCRPIAITVNAADGEVLDIDATSAD